MQKGHDFECTIEMITHALSEWFSTQHQTNWAGMINLHVWVNIATIWLLGPRGHNATVDTIYDADYPGYTHTYTLHTHRFKNQNHTH